jgi:UDP-N-acetyl-2-amino-2-deoxyglucuronate dehydrogenase
MKTYALVGAGGYIAPKHMKAIYETGGELLFAYDVSDSVGILDKWAKDCMFTTDEEIFWGLVKITRPTVVICTPNHTHEHFMVTANAYGCEVICEKPLFLPEKINDVPLILNDWNVYPILQLRIHPEVQRMKRWIMSRIWAKDRTVITIDYVTVRGNWYQKSWKHDRQRSGGLVYNIGIHLLDMLFHVFGFVGFMGNAIQAEWIREGTSAQICIKGPGSGPAILLNLSVDRDDLPDDIGRNSFRQVSIDMVTDKIDFNLDGNFTDLHTAFYQNILDGTAPTIKDALPALNLAYLITEKLYKE